MAYPSTHYLLSFGGTLKGEESWTMGLRIIGLGALDQNGEEAVLADYVAALESAWGTQVVTGQGTRLTWAKLNQIGIDGKYTKSWTNLHEWDLPGVSAPGAGSMKPNQITMVVSLTTNTSRGLAHAGRLYFPAPGADIQADGRVSVAHQGDQLASAKAFIDTLNNASDGSIIIASKVREGAQHTVTGVRIGRVLDTMRSRRSSMKEEHLPATLDSAGWGGGGGPF